VFDAIAESAKQLLGGYSATVVRVVGDSLHLAAFAPIDPAADEALNAMYPVRRHPLAWLEDVIMRQGFLEAADIETDLDGALRNAGRARAPALDRAFFFREGQASDFVNLCGWRGAEM
jgi:two-component system, NtrC family, sensor kinase